MSLMVHGVLAVGILAIFELRLLYFIRSLASILCLYIGSLLSTEPSWGTPQGLGSLLALCTLVKGDGRAAWWSAVCLPDPMAGELPLT